MRIALGVCGLAAVDGWHVSGMPQPTRHPLLRTQRREPGPGDETRDSHHAPLSVRRDGLEKQGRGRLNRAVEQDGTIVLNDTDLQAAGLHI